MPDFLSSWRIYAQPRMIALLALGIASGLPLPLVISTLSVWLAQEGVTKTAIGLFAAVGTPYALKFLWAPLIDQIHMPILKKMFGRRRSWILVTQAALMLCLWQLGMTDPATDPLNTAFWAVLTAIASASQDIVIDAYRVEILPVDQQAAGAASLVLGYNISMRLIGGAGALILASIISWQWVYLIMAAVILIGTAAIFVAGEPEDASDPEPKQWLDWIKHAVVDPFADFMQRPHWWLPLLFIIFYKFGDAFAGIMTNPFLIDIGFSPLEIGTIVKTFGLGATLVGTFVGGWLVHRLGMMPALWICGILQMLSNLIFVLQAQAGYNLPLLYITIAVENLSSGMGTTAFVAYLSSLCHVSYTATQYALLSSLASIGRTWLSTGSGVLVDSVGWSWFFFSSTFFAIPGLFLLYYMSKHTAPPSPKTIPTTSMEVP